MNDGKRRGRPAKHGKRNSESTNAGTNCSQPLVLASVSDWVVSGNVIASSIRDVKKDSSLVSLLHPEQIGSFRRGSVKDDAIDISEDSEVENVMYDEKVDVKKEEKYYDVFSVDGTDVILDSSEFDADALYNETNNNEPYEVEPYEVVTIVQKLKHSNEKRGWIT